MRVAFALVVVLLAGCGKKVAPNPENQFQQMMTGAVLVGHSTLDGKDGLSGEERYSIESVHKLAGDVWMFQSRMKIEGHDIPLPIPVAIKWAGDTPVIEVTDMRIPGLGTFTARVLFYGDRYVGTWNGGAGHGGTLWGRIEHGEPAARPATQPSR